MIRSLLLAALVVCPIVHGQSPAQIEVSSAWARATVEGQHGTGAFMRLLSRDGARVVGASSEAAEVVEIHEMVMQGNVMRMRPIVGLDLPPGQPVDLKPGGHHMMLMDLKRPLKNGEKIKVDLRVETRDRKLLTQSIEVEVRPRAP